MLSEATTSMRVKLDWGKILFEGPGCIHLGWLQQKVNTPANYKGFLERDSNYLSGKEAGS